MEVNKKKVFATFFGTPELPNGSVIITPINKIYKKIKSKYSVIEETKGWWQRIRVKINSRIVLILKIPPGSHIKDCLKIIDSEKIQTIILLGFCGSLNENLKIGNVVMPQKEKYKVVNVSQMILETSILQKLKKEKVDLLDMETYFLDEWGKVNHVPVISVLIVTDLPNSLPFFFCTKNDLQKIDRSITEIVDKLKEYLTNTN